MQDIQKVVCEKTKQSELWKTVCDRVVNYLPENEIELIKSSTEIEQLNIFESYKKDMDDDQVYKQKHMLKSTITKLNDENFNLKMHLERLKNSNKTEIERLNKVQSENEKLRNDIDLLRELHSNEIKINSKNNYEMKKEIENYKVQLKFEENQREELKNKYTNELNAAKIRYENELNKQNQIMQTKYDDLNKEITRLNKIIKSLQLEKSELIHRIQKEREINRELIEQKESFIHKSCEK